MSAAASDRITDDDARVIARIWRRAIQRRPAPVPEQRDGDDDADEGEAAGP